jgi:hypothetical protein
MPRHRSADVGEKFFVVPRLLDEVLRASTNGVDDIADGPISRDHNDRKIGLHLDDARQQVDTALARQSQVEKKQVIFIARQQLQTRGPVYGRAYREAFEGQQGIERFADRVFIIDDENARLSDHARRTLQMKCLGCELCYFRH